MFAIAFDIIVADADLHHPKGNSQAYADIRSILEDRGFQWTQYSVYVTKNDDMANLVGAILDLRELAWFRKSVRDIRAFRVEQWSDFTIIVKGLSSDRTTTPRVKEPVPLYA